VAYEGELMLNVRDPESHFSRALLDGYDVENAPAQHEVWINYALSANERGAEVLRVVQGVVPGLRGKRHLDVGCAYGGACVAAGRLGAVSIGIDVDPTLLRFAEANRKDHPSLPLEFHEASAMDLSLRDRLGSFDVITCDNVIEHVECPERLVANIAALLAPDGVAYVTIPNAYSLGQIRSDCHYGQFGISLLDACDGAAYMKDVWGRAVYDVSAYYRFDLYHSIFTRYGLSPTLVVETAADAWKVAWEGVQALPQELQQAKVPETLRPKLQRAVEAHVARFRTDVEAWRTAPETLRNALARRMARDYVTEVWCVVAVRDGLRSAAARLGDQASSLAELLRDRARTLRRDATSAARRRAGQLWR
jgi:SAM-dependent methyltransferase